MPAGNPTYLSPEEIQQLNALSGLGGQQRLLAEQLRRQADKKFETPAYGTATGAALGGLATMMQERDRDTKLASLAEQLRGLDTQRTEGLSAARGAIGRLPTADPGALFSDDPAQRQAGASSLADAIRGREQLGAQLAASGDPELAALGAGLLGSSEKLGGYGFEAAQGAPTRALQGAQLKKSQREEEAATAPAMQAYHDLAAKFGVSLPQGATNEQAREALALAEKAYAAEQLAKDRALNREAMRANREDAKTDREEKELDKQIETLSKRLEGAPSLRSDLATLSKYADAADVPGMGPLEGRAPNWMVGEEGVRVRQAARGVAGTILHERSGTAASEAEIGRLLEETGMGPTATPTQFREGLRRLREQAFSILRSKEAGARPEAVQEAQRRGMVTSADLPAATSGLPADKQKRLDELRRKRDAGALK